MSTTILYNNCLQNELYCKTLHLKFLGTFTSVNNAWVTWEWSENGSFLWILEQQTYPHDGGVNWDKPAVVTAETWIFHCTLHWQWLCKMQGLFMQNINTSFIQINTASCTQMQRSMFDANVDRMTSAIVTSTVIMVTNNSTHQYDWKHLSMHQLHCRCCVL